MNLNERISEIIADSKSQPMILSNLKEDCSIFIENVYEIDDFKKLSLSEFDMEYVVLLLIVRPDFSMENLNDFYDLFTSNIDESDIENGLKIGVSISESTEREIVYMFTKN